MPEIFFFSDEDTRGYSRGDGRARDMKDKAGKPGRTTSDEKESDLAINTRDTRR